MINASSFAAENAESTPATGIERNTTSGYASELPGADRGAAIGVSGRAGGAASTSVGAFFDDPTSTPICSWIFTKNSGVRSPAAISYT